MERQLAFNVQPDNVRRENIPARSAQVLTEAEHGGMNQNTGMADLHAAVIVVQRVAMEPLVRAASETETRTAAPTTDAWGGPPCLTT